MHDDRERPGISRRTLLAAATAALAAPGVGIAAASSAAHPFQNPSHPVAARVKDLLGRLTLDEKISLLHQYQPAVDSLGIKSFRTGTEALHGVAWLGKATVFPQAIGLASTWDRELLERVGSAVGDEARGFQQERPTGWGLNLWAPVANLLRDPRWGRNEEGYSEDPHLTGVLSTAYGKGLTGGDPEHLKTAPTIKHYLANNNEADRAATSSDLRPRVLREYDEAAFRPAVEAGAVTGVMAAYNLVNGRPCTVNPDLDATVRSWTDHDLLNVTDAWAPNNLVTGVGVQDYYPTLAEADAAALKAGIDSYTTDDTNSAPTTTALKKALSEGLLEESDIDRAAGHVLAIRVRLGEFDPGGGRYGSIGKDAIDTPAHRALARESATKAAVLLKNTGRTLPLDPGRVTEVAVVGPLADTLYTDWYAGTLPYAVTPRDGVAAKLGEAAVTSSEGVDRIALRNTSTGLRVTAGAGTAGAPLRESDAADDDAAAHFDVFDWGADIVTLRAVANGLYVGRGDAGFVNDQAQPNGWYVQQQFTLEREADDAYLLKYAGYETADSWWTSPVYLGPTGSDGKLGLVEKASAARYAREVVRSGADEAVAAVTGKGAAIVVIGSMPAINGRENHDRTSLDIAPAQAALVKAVAAANPRTVVVVENSYPTALGELAARVPALLWISHAGQETGNALADLLFGDANPAGRLTQTWYRSEDDLPSILEYDIIKHERTYWYFKGRPLYPFGYGLSYTSFAYGDVKRFDGGCSVAVTNTGRRAGDEVVQLYVRQRTSRVVQPLRRLKSFARVSLKPGETKTVRLPLTRSDLAHWDVTRDKWVVESATYDILVGASSSDIRARTTWKVAGETVPPRDLSRTTRAENFDDYASIRLADESKARGTVVSATADGAWVSYADALLVDGGGSFTARLAGGAGQVQIRLGGPEGRLLGSVAFAGTDSGYAYAAVTGALRGVPGGRGTVCVVLPKGVRMASFAVRAAAGGGR
ncbi:MULTISPECIES: glycoside hydrolase family 3 protein [unclassified Streptomyces]|uniref:glycoside hydrolase family 3 protein n=1 Tax=unclassified Streptomyces TaxID=2593676 RepID=UPI00278C063C|nr:MULTISPECIES: glycoside hydrolase family 3 protein [unclassified Streptomyces]